MICQSYGPYALFVIISETIIHANVDRHLEQSYIGKMLDNNEYLSLPYVFNDVRTRDIIFDKSPFSEALCKSLHEQLNQFSMSKSRITGILKSGANHPIKSFIEVYGKKFDEIIYSRLKL